MTLTLFLSLFDFFFFFFSWFIFSLLSYESVILEKETTIIYSRQSVHQWPGSPGFIPKVKLYQRLKKFIPCLLA